MSEERLPAKTDNAVEKFRSLDLTAPQDIAQVMVASGYFRDATALSEAAAKIIAGRELGFGPFASMQGIDIVEGKMRVASATLGALVKEHPDYEYRVREWDETCCRIEFFGRTLDGSGDFESIGFGSWTLEEAKQGGAKFTSRSGKSLPWTTYPRAMLWARAMSNGVNAHCPNVGKGIRIYTEGDEFGMPSRPVEPAKTDALNESLEG